MSVLEIRQAIAWELRRGRPLCKDPVGSKAFKFLDYPAPRAGVAEQRQCTLTIAHQIQVERARRLRPHGVLLLSAGGADNYPI